MLVDSGAAIVWEADSLKYYSQLQLAYSILIVGLNDTAIHSVGPITMIED